MSILHVSNKDDISNLKKVLNKPMAILVYMEGCGPCNATRPEWAKIKTDKIKNKNINIIDLNKDLLDDELQTHIGSIDGFPTIKIIDGSNKQDYSGNRTVNDLIDWINKHNKTKGGKKRRTKRRTKRTRSSRKMREYKRKN
jgi:thiol-disulfide isomerase/thioredoxin